MQDDGLRCGVFDLDSFFASVEEKHRGTTGVPLVVAAGARGAVTSANRAAKQLGVKAGEPISRLVRVHPGVIVAPARMELYRAESRHVMAVLAASGFAMRQLSVDEACLDLRDARDGLGGHAAVRVAERLRRQVRHECGLVISAGVSRGRVSAKIAVDDAKPDGLLAVPAGEVDAWLAAKPLGAIPGIGPVSARELARRGVLTGADAVRAGDDVLVRALGRARAAWLLGVLDGSADGVDTEWEAASRSVSAERTLPSDVDDDSELGAWLDGLVADVCGRMLEAGEWAGGVRVTVRGSDGVSTSRQRRCDPARGFVPVRRLAGELLAEIRSSVRGAVRLVGVGAFELVDARDETLFDDVLDGVSDGEGFDEIAGDVSRRGDDVGEVWTHPVFGDGLVVAKHGHEWVVSFPGRRRVIDVRHVG
jgi:DNA polymerase-4